LFFIYRTALTTGLRVARSSVRYLRSYKISVRCKFAWALFYRYYASIAAFIHAGLTTRGNITEFYSLVLFARVLNELFSSELLARQKWYSETISPNAR